MSTSDTPDDSPPEVDEQPQDGSESPEDPDAGQEPQEEAEEGPGREAARYRRRLREVEQERDRLAGQVEHFQRAEVERVAGDAMGSPGDLWLTGADLAGFLDDDGRVDGDKVAEAIDLVLADRPHWRRTSTPPVPSGARGGGASAETSWAELLRPR